MFHVKHFGANGVSPSHPFLGEDSLPLMMLERCAGATPAACRERR